MSLFMYEIAAPTNVVEASASPEPDDVNVAYVRIEATALKDIKKGDIGAIRFVINVLPELKKPAEDATKEEKDEIEESNDRMRQAALTRNPGNITPVAAAFRHWTFSAPGEKGIFVARPDAATDEADDQSLAKSGEVLVFYLYDIEVIDRDGETKIKVTEVDRNEKDIPDPIPDLVIRKIFPALRIDFFTADKLAVKAGAQVKLEWATTSATKILLNGITATDIALSDNPVALEDPFLDGYQILETNLPGQQVAQKDGNFFVRPETTTAYTLQARSNNADTVALQQLTISVSDQVETNRLVGNQLEIHSSDGIISTSSSQIQTNGIRITSNNDNVRNPVTPGSLQADGNLRVSGRTNLDGDIHINKGISNRAKIRVTGDIVGEEPNRTSDAKLHFDLLDSSDASGWTEDVLVMHGNGHVGVGSSTVDDSNKLTVTGNTKVSKKLTTNSIKVESTGPSALEIDGGTRTDRLSVTNHTSTGSLTVEGQANLINALTVSGQAKIRDGLVPTYDSSWRHFDMRPNDFATVEQPVSGIKLEDYILDIKVLYKTANPGIHDVTNQVKISYLQSSSSTNIVLLSISWYGFSLPSLETSNLGKLINFKDGFLRFLVWKVPCDTSKMGTDFNFS